MQNRNAELAKLSDDLNNVLDGANVPILIMGEDGRIRRFTRSAEDLLNLLPGDVGRPMNNIRPNVDLPELDTIVNQVSRTFAEVQKEIRDKKGRWYSLRIRPYRTADNKIDGVLMAFLDIDAMKRSNQALSESEAMVRALIESLVRAILVIDEAGKIVMVNAAAEKMFQYTREQLLGETLEVLLPEGARVKHQGYRAEYFKSPKIRIMGEGLYTAGLRKDGTEFPTEVSLSYIQVSGGTLAVAFVSDLSRQRKIEASLAETEHALRESEKQLQMFAGSLLAAQEEEKARLAGELHDDLSQRLAGLALKTAETEQRFRDQPPEVREQISSLRRIAEDLSGEIRDIAHQLHPSVLEHFGLSKALSSYCEEFGAVKGLHIRFRHRSVPEMLPPQIALCLFRVAQEALSNTAKHASANTASVLLVGSGHSIQLAAHDDGVGFDPDTLLAHSGLGLVSMRERLRLVGGSLTVKGRPGGPLP
jgi:PAS domain S-box-containing protein